MDSTFEAYDANLFTIYDNSYPIVRRAFMNNGTKNNEWLTPGIKACIKKKSKLYKIFLGLRIIRESYTDYANKLTALLNRVRSLYYFKLFSCDRKNCSKAWLYINRLVGNSTKGPMDKLSVGVKLSLE